MVQEMVGRVRVSVFHVYPTKDLHCTELGSPSPILSGLGDPALESSAFLQLHSSDQHSHSERFDELPLRFTIQHAVRLPHAAVKHQGPTAFGVHELNLNGYQRGIIMHL